MNSIIILILIFALFLLAMIIILRWRLNRAIRQVIQIFRKHNATDAKNAKTDEELGLRPRSFMEGIFKGRDYRPYALSGLMKAEIIQQTEDGRLYLSEEKLSASPLSKHTPYSR